RLGVDLLEYLDLAIEALHVGGPHDDRVTRLGALGDAVDALVERLVRVELEAVEVLDLAVARSLYPTWVLRRVLRHHHRGLGVERVHLEAGAVVHARVDGAP